MLSRTGCRGRLRCKARWEHRHLLGSGARTLRPPTPAHGPDGRPGDSTPETGKQPGVGGSALFLAPAPTAPSSPSPSAVPSLDPRRSFGPACNPGRTPPQLPSRQRETRIRHPNVGDPAHDSILTPDP